MTLRNIFVFISCCVLFLSSCSKDKTEIDPFADLTCDGEVFFSTEIAPIIQQNCSTTDCHDAAATAGYSFLNYQSIADNGDIIYKAMKHEASLVPMPYDLPKLQDSLINKFGCWLSQGKPNN